MRIFSDKKRLRILIWSAVAIVILVSVIVCAVYLGDYYRADEDAIAALGMSDVPERTIDGGIAFGDEDAEAGFIFYPGGKVEYTSYIPLMRSIASRGVLCVLVEMPFNLAILDMNAADRARAEYPEIDKWYIGGHSLGGSMAASHVASREGVYDGLVLLGAYSTEDLAKKGVSVLSVYGSEDGVMNREKYAECIANLPDDYEEVVIDGGCHAYFGAYGAQDGDGEPDIGVAEQIAITSERILGLIIKEG